MTTQTVSASSASLVLSKDLWREWKVDPTDASFVTVGLSAEQDEPELLQIASRAVDLMTTVSPAAVLARVDELEVELRSTVLQLAEGLVPPIEKGVSLHANSEEEEAIVVSRLLRYVQSAMGLCWHVVEFHPTSAAAMNMWRKVPFLLLEDMLDVVPLRWVQQRVWPQGAEPWIRGMLSRPTLLGASTNKLVLIRVCNQLLKQLSLSEELAGRVMMVLAAVFPLSERSGVNVLGTVRATPTILETPSEYSQHHSITQQAHPPKTNAPNSSSSSSLALDVCDEKVGGMEEVVAEIIQFQQQQQQQQQVNGSDGMVHIKEEEEESKMDYDFYHVFWGLQNIFADYSSVLPSSSSKSSSGDPPNLWQHKLLEFISHAQQVLAAFEGHAFPSPERVSHSDRTTMTKTSSHAHTEDSSSLSTTRVMGHCHKYMTNSELLHLQLKDPELRIHILTQLLIVVPHLHQSCSVSGAAAAASGASTTTNNEYFMIRSKLLQLQQRAEELLNVVPPNGSQHLRTVQWLLKERESMWKRWKKTKCKPLEKTLLTTTTTTTTSHHETKKRRLVEERGSEAVVASVKRIRAALPSISKELRTRATPKLYDFLEEYVEALDPEAGIEDEYHPRNDKVFSWRALRLMRMQQTISPSLIRRTDGDFEAMVRHIWQHERNITIPKAPTPPPTPDPPTPPPEVVEESVPTTMEDVDDIYGDIEMKEAPTDGKDTAVTKKDKDEDDAASVGSAFSVGSAVSGTLLEEDTPSKNMMDHDGPKEKREETEMESLSSSTHHKPALEESKAAKLKEMEEMVAEEEEAEMMVVKQEPTSKEPVGDVISEKEPMTEKKEKGPKIEGKSKESKAEKKENESKAESAEKEKELPIRDPSPEMNGGDSGRRNNQKTHSPGGEKQDRRGSEGGRGGDSGHRGRGGSSSRDRDGDRRRGGGSYTSRGGGGEREPRRGSDNRRGGGGGSNNRRRHNHRS